MVARLQFVVFSALSGDAFRKMFPKLSRMVFWERGVRDSLIVFVVALKGLELPDPPGDILRHGGATLGF